VTDWLPLVTRTIQVNDPVNNVLSFWWFLVGNRLFADAESLQRSSLFATGMLCRF